MTRAFIAIELPKEIKSFLAVLQDELKKSGADVKWVEPQNIHLTLKFLGERDEKKVKRIAEILEETTSTIQPYRIRLFSLGGFPRIESVRVIWVGIDKGDAETKKIASLLEEKIAEIGIPKENRPFSSHITIGRTKSTGRLKELSCLLQKLQNKPQEKITEFEVEKIILFKSTLTPHGPIYEAIKEASLKAI